MIQEDFGPLRRIVTAQRPGEPSSVATISAPPFTRELPDGTKVHELWITHATPEEMRHDDREPITPEMGMNPPMSGTVLRIAEVAPAKNADTSPDAAREMFERLGGVDSLVDGSEDPRGHMHRTDSIDYVVVLSGSLTLALETEDVILKPGDVVVQRGSNHFWYNHTDEIARLAFVMIGANAPAA